MKKLLHLGALLAAASLGLQDISVGHGGTYRGPGDTVPPGGGGGGGGGGPATPGPSGPSTPGPAGPSSPGPASPGAPAGAPGGGPSAPTTGGGGAAGPDLTVWQFWWGFNRDPYLNLKAKIHAGEVATGSDEFFLGRGEQIQAKDSMGPSEATIRGTVVPALIRALEKERSNDILTGAMIALAKIGDAESETGESEFEKVISKFLADGNQEVAETAALALGILANEASVDTLIELMKDEAPARRKLKKTEVPYRTRAFAAYGLGLIGNQSSDNALRQKIAEHLIDILESPHFSTRDLKVGAMTALGLIPIDVSDGAAAIPEGEDPSSNARHVVSRQSQIAYILDYFDIDNARANKTTRHWFVRAHAPTAMARLLPGAPAELKASVAATLLSHSGKHSKAKREIIQSCTLALGVVGDCDNDKIDDTIRKELIRLIKNGDQQSRRFALIALAQVGGKPGTGDAPLGGIKDVRGELLKQLSKGSAPIRPWAGLALGVSGRLLLDNDQPIDPGVSSALRQATRECKRPDMIGAYAIALGIRRDTESKKIILQKLDDFKGSDDARGYCAVALGLMDDRSAIEPIQNIIRKSKYKPDLLKQAAIALGLLGDKELVDDLIAMLGEAKGLATQAAISSALGSIGDARSIDPLVEMLDNKQITDTARGFAAVALGIVCDKESLPWNSKISSNINYRANTTTLTSAAAGTGILDIL
ncbi:MAG: HEAT repeat domain-containing protein [Planctomycetota bacterium]|nr:MAG: HEAT repeat domain-containing protein [Planctomycetota bacterium]